MPYQFEIDVSVSPAAAPRTPSTITAPGEQPGGRRGRPVYPGEQGQEPGRDHGGAADREHAAEPGEHWLGDLHRDDHPDHLGEQRGAELAIAEPDLNPQFRQPGEPGAEHQADQQEGPGDRQAEAPDVG